MTKAPSAFRSIGELARLAGVPAHVLRYWETQFVALTPVKRADGRRYYRPDDVALVLGIHEALREDGLTIRGANKLIAQDRGAALRAKGAARLRRTEASRENATPEQTSAGQGAPAQRGRPSEGAGTGGPSRRATSSDTRPPPAPSSKQELLFADHVGKDRPVGPAQAEPRAPGPKRGPFQGSGATLPLFADPDAPQPLCLLERLRATSAALRDRAAPLPAQAAPIAAALRHAWLTHAARVAAPFP